MDEMSRDKRTAPNMRFSYMHTALTIRTPERLIPVHVRRNYCLWGLSRGGYKRHLFSNRSISVAPVEPNPRLDLDVELGRRQRLGDLAGDPGRTLLGDDVERLLERAAATVGAEHPRRERTTVDDGLRVRRGLEGVAGVGDRVEAVFVLSVAPNTDRLRTLLAHVVNTKPLSSGFSGDELPENRG